MLMVGDNSYKGIPKTAVYRDSLLMLVMLMLLMVMVMISNVISFFGGTYSSSLCCPFHSQVDNDRSIAPPAYM